MKFFTLLASLLFATHLSAEASLPSGFPPELLEKLPVLASGKAQCAPVPQSLFADPTLVVLTYACAMPPSASAPPYLIEVTAHFAQIDGIWARTGLRALDTFSAAPMSGFPSWQEFQTLSPARIEADMAATLAQLWPDLPRETASHSLYAILGLKFSDSTRLRHWMEVNRPDFNAFKDALLQRRSKSGGASFALSLREDGNTPLGLAMMRLGLHNCIVTRAGVLDASVMEPDTPEIDCSYAHAGGDNRAGFLWSSTPDRIPRLRLNRVYFLLDLGGGWFAYRET